MYFTPAELVRGKRVLITGSSTGIGEQIAYEFAQMGAHIMLTARRHQRLQEVANQCLKLGAASADYVASDMGNLTSAQYVAQETVKKLGGLDYLVLNHIGGSASFGFFKGDMDPVVGSITINFLSYVQLTSTALRALQESQGSIVVMSSMSGRIGAPFTTSYCASKFALEGFYSSLRREFDLQKNNMSVTVAILGYIDTGINAGFLPRVELQTHCKNSVSHSLNLKDRFYEKLYRGYNIICLNAFKRALDEFLNNQNIQGYCDTNIYS
ncbi:hypothetical protein XENTR_v10002310 [Xenopus tropicalis]|nr:hypothetical protein XENTR_v10002310 [Xenopus tropicalis]